MSRAVLPSVAVVAALGVALVAVLLSGSDGVARFDAEEDARGATREEDEADGASATLAADGSDGASGTRTQLATDEHSDGSSEGAAAADGGSASPSLEALLGDEPLGRPFVHPDAERRFLPLYEGRTRDALFARLQELRTRYRQRTDAVEAHLVATGRVIERRADDLGPMPRALDHTLWSMVDAADDDATSPGDTAKVLLVWIDPAAYPDVYDLRDEVRWLASHLDQGQDD